MDVIARISIPGMFTSIIKNERKGLMWSSEYSHYCTNCEQTFFAKWLSDRKGGNYVERGEFFLCPHCRQENMPDTTTYIAKNDTYAPKNIVIELIKYTHIIKIQVKAVVISLSKEEMNAQSKNYVESITFNVGKRMVTFKNNLDNPISASIGNPLLRDFEKNSMLRYLTRNAAKGELRKITDFMLELRNVVDKMHTDIFGFPLKSTWVPAGTKKGLILHQILNLAWRLRAPDAPNLQNVINTTFNKLEAWAPTLDHTFAAILENKSYAQSALKIFGVPDKPATRRIISTSKNPFEISLLDWAFKACPDYDGALKIYEIVNKNFEISATNLGWHINKSLEFIKALANHWGLQSAIAILGYRAGQYNGDYQIYRDCASMFNKLTAVNREKFLANKIPTKKIHDTLVKIYNEQGEEDYDLRIAEATKMRLRAENEHLKFFVPDTKNTLKEAGQDLSICVGTYAERVLDGECVIVLIADEREKLIACLEIDGNSLKQAKLDHNKLLKSNEKLNSLVIKWCQEKGIKVDTTDAEIGAVA